MNCEQKLDVILNNTSLILNEVTAIKQSLDNSTSSSTLLQKVNKILAFLGLE